MFKLSSNLDEYTIFKSIGAGSFGQVHIIKEKKTGKAYAAKISFISLDEESKSTARNIQREVNILSRLNHPSILKFIGFSPKNFHGENKPVIITEYMINGSLNDILKLNRQMSPLIFWTDTRKVITIYGIASAMNYLHHKKIIHRDLKPDNILMDDYLFPKICDFGLSKMMHTNFETMTVESTISVKGTPLYIAPEIWDECEYSTASDVYAFSLVLYEIITDVQPNINCKSYQIPQKVIEGLRPEFKTHIQEDFKNLIEKCWQGKSEERPSFDQILEIIREKGQYFSENVNEKEMKYYFEFIDYCMKEEETGNKILSIDKFKNTKYQPFKKISISQFISKQKPTEQEENNDDIDDKNDNQQTIKSTNPKSISVDKSGTTSNKIKKTSNKKDKVAFNRNIACSNSISRQSRCLSSFYCYKDIHNFHFDSRPLEEKLDEINTKLKDKNYKDINELFNLLISRKSLSFLKYGDESIQSLNALLDISRFYIEQKNPQSALRHLSNSHKIYKTIKLSKVDRLLLSIEIAELYLLLGSSDQDNYLNAEKALLPFVDFKNDNNEIEDKMLIYKKDLLYARVQSHKCRYDKVLSLYERAIESLNTANEGNTCSNTAFLYFEIGEFAKLSKDQKTAVKMFKKAYEIFVELNMTNEAKASEDNINEKK